MDLLDLKDQLLTRHAGGRVHIKGPLYRRKRLCKAEVISKEGSVRVWVTALPSCTEQEL